MAEDIFDPEVAVALPMLASPDAAVRRIGLRQIVDYVDEYPQLFVHASADVDAGVRGEAAAALEATTDPAGVAALVGLLGDSDSEVARIAAESLAEILDPAVGPLLHQYLPNASGLIRARLFAALRKLRHAPSAPLALSSLNDPLPAVRREAVGLLAYLKLPETLEALAQRVTQDGEAEVRRVATGALSFAVGAEVLPALLQALRDSDWQVREEAAVTLGKLLLPAAADGLIAALDDASWEVRVKAANVLGRLREVRAVPPLTSALDYPISNLRKEAVTALAAIGGPSIVPALKKALADSDVDVHKIAARALAALEAGT